MKSDTLNLRISPATKSVLRFIADRDRRSMSNMIDFLVTDYCAKNGLCPPAEQQVLKNANKPNGFDGSSITTRTRRKGVNDT